MKIVIVHQQNPRDINAFSGTPHFMTNAIKEEFEEVVEYDLFEFSETSRRAHFNGIELGLKPFGDQLTSHLRANKVEADFLICQGGSSCIPFYQYPIPMILWHDSTWHTFLGGYLNATAFDKFKSSFNNLYLWDKAVLQKTNILVYSSIYVAEAAIGNYHIPVEKVKVIPFGANIYRAPTADVLEMDLAEKRESRILNLTFVGKDWQRKGLISAFALTKALNSSGINAILNIVGCDPGIDEVNNSPFTILWGFLNKSIASEYGKLEMIYRRTHFLIHPAVAEPFGVSLCEANAYGIPVIGTRVEGLKTIVTTGVNGCLFDAERFVGDACSIIEKTWRDFDGKYLPLCLSSADEYRRKFNWKTNVCALKNILLETKRDSG